MKTSKRTLALFCLSLLSVETTTTALSPHRENSLRAQDFRHLQFEDEGTAEQFAAPYVGPLDDTSIRTAVHAWVTSSDKSQAIAQYGPIEAWDTSRVTDMSRLFSNARFFNEQGIGNWNTSSVTDMKFVFAFCSSLNVDLSLWDTSRVTNLGFAFHQATQFEGQGLRHWNVGKVLDMTYFAQGASKFQEPLWRWTTGNVRSFNRAFHNASLWHEQLCWELHPKATAVQTFCGTLGAFFNCDPHNALTSEINQQYHECCDCAYDWDAGYHTLEDDDYWANEEKDQKMGVILASIIWAMVFFMLVLVVGITLRRRTEVRQWWQSKLSGPEQLAPDGGAIATFVGPADTTGSTTTGSSPRNHPTVAANPHDNIPMVVAGLPTPTTSPATGPPPAEAWATTPQASTKSVQDWTTTTSTSLTGPTQAWASTTSSTVDFSHPTTVHLSRVPASTNVPGSIQIPQARAQPQPQQEEDFAT